MDCVECGSSCGVVWMGRKDFLAHRTHFRGKIRWDRETKAASVFWWCHHCTKGGAVVLPTRKSA